MKARMQQLLSRLKFRAKKLSKRTVVLSALLGLLLMFWIAYILYHSLNPPAAVIEPIRAQTVRVKEDSMPQAVETVGSLTAVKELKIKSAGAGRVQSILIPSGSWVNKGTALISIIAAPEVHAPFDGYLTDWLVTPGEYVAPGTELVTLVETETLLLTYRIPEHYAAKLDNNQTVEVFHKAYPDKAFLGTVGFISPMVDKKTYTILIKAAVKNPDQQLWPGMSAHVRHILEVKPKVLIIPESALMLTLEGYEVFIVKDNKIEKRRVKIGDRKQGRVEIISGLQLDEQVILTRTESMGEGNSAEATDWQGAW